MPNFTVAIPADLLADAKVAAARANTSLSQLVRVLLEGCVKNQSIAMSGNFDILLRFSLGQITAQQAQKLLHLDDPLVLDTMLSSAGLPMPRLSLQQTDAMQRRFGEMLDRAETA